MTNWQQQRKFDRELGVGAIRDLSDIPQTWIRPYYASFNGLRGCAILLVFCRHYLTLISPYQIFWGGWVGVDLFFVVSGFLITGILYDSVEHPRYFSSFYIRRALRIFPLFYGLFALVAFLRQVGWAKVTGSIWFFATYLGNLPLAFLVARHHNPSIIPITIHPGWALRIDHLWSLCVEEQFYLVWPLIIAKVRSRRQLLNICSVGIVLTLVFRILIFTCSSPMFLSYGLLYHATYTRCDTLLMGSFLALWLRRAKPSRRQLRTLAYILAVPSSLVIGVGVLLTIRRWPISASNPFIATIGFTLIGLFMSGIVISCLDEDSLFARAMKQRFLGRLGVISYGVYIFHELFEPIVAHTLRSRPHTPLGAFSIVTAFFIFTILLASVSFRYYEAPFLRLKSILAPATDTSVASANEGTVPAVEDTRNLDQLRAR